MGLKELAKKVKKEEKDKNKPFEELFLEMLDNYFIKLAKQEDEEHGHSVSIKPSSYYKCMRKLWYQLLKFPKNERKFARSQRILQVGTALHEWIQNNIFINMAEEGYAVELIPVEELPNYKLPDIKFIKEHDASPMEVKFRDYRYTKKYPISAMVDGALEWKRERFLFEFKTIRHDDFELLYEPLKDHIKQGAIYALSTGIHRVMFLYLDKDTQNFKAYLITYTKEQLDWVIDRVVTFENYLLNKELPPKEDDINVCKWCGYRKLCNKEACGTTFKEDENGFSYVEEV